MEKAEILFVRFHFYRCPCFTASNLARKFAAAVVRLVLAALEAFEGDGWASRDLEVCNRDPFDGDGWASLEGGRDVDEEPVAMLGGSDAEPLVEMLEGLVFLAFVGVESLSSTEV